MMQLEFLVWLKHAELRNVIYPCIADSVMDKLVKLILVTSSFLPLCEEPSATAIIFDKK